MVTAAWASEAAAGGTLGADPSVTKPSGTVSGDFLVAVGVASGAGTITKPDASWTTDPNSVSGTQPLFWKIAGGSEPASYTFVVSGTSSSIIVISRYTGVNAATPVHASSGVATTATTVTIPGVTVTGTSKFLAQLVTRLNNTIVWTPPGTATERWDHTSGPGSTAGGDEVVAVGGTGNRVWTTTGLTAPTAGYILALNDANTAFTKSMTAVMDGTPSISRKVGKFLTAVMDGTPTLAKMLTIHRTQSAVMDGTPTISRKPGLFLTAVMDGTASLSVKVGKTLTAIMDGTGSILRKTGKTLSAVMDGTPMLARDVTAHRTLEVVMNGQTTLTRRLSLLNELVAVMNGTATLGSRNVFGRVLTAVMNGIPRGFLTFPWDSIPSDCPPDWSPNDGLRCIAGDVFFHEPPNEGDPVEGATVCLIRDDDGLRVECDLTDASGHYSFPRDTNDPYTYHVEVTYDDGGVKQQGMSEGGCVPSSDCP